MAIEFLPLTLVHLPFYVAAFIMLGLAGALLWIDPKKRTHVSFAVFMLFSALSLLAGVFRNAGSAYGRETVLFYHAMYSYLAIPLIPLLAYFASVYPRPRGVLGTTKWGPRSLVAATVAAELLFLWDHRLMETIGQAAANGRLSSVSSSLGLYVVDYGPLSFLLELRLLATGIVLLAFTRDLVRMERGSSRFSMWLIVASMATGALFTSTLRVNSFVVFVAAEGAAFPMAPFGWVHVVGLAAPIVPVVVALVTLVRHEVLNRAPDGNHRVLTALLALSALAILTPMLAVGLFGMNALIGFGAPTLLLYGFWVLVLPVCATYALARYNLFDIDFKVRMGLQHGSVAAVFLFVFFLVSEGAETLVEDQVSQILGIGAGQFFGLVAAGILTFAIRPLERMGSRLAGRAMPDAKPVNLLSAKERRKMFEEQLELAMQDGVLTDKERAMLETLKERLGVPRSQVPSLDSGVAAA